MTEAVAEQLDARGLACPLPILRARRALRDLAPGTLLTVLATDPGATGDFKAFCAQTGHTLVEWSEADGVYSYLIRRGT